MKPIDLKFEKLKNTKTAITCGSKDEWYKVLNILGANEHLIFRYDLNVIPGLIANTISLANNMEYSFRNIKSYYEDKGFTVIAASDFIAANTFVGEPSKNENEQTVKEQIKPEPEKISGSENMPKTRFQAGHEYIVATGSFAVRAHYKVKIIEVTKKCYNCKFENAQNNTWYDIYQFENDHALIEDITANDNKLTETEKAILAGMLTIVAMSFGEAMVMRILKDLKKRKKNE